MLLQMKSNDQLQLTKYKSHETGNLNEEIVLGLLSNFDNVEKVWKDNYNSKFDLYYVLKNEDVIKGLQVKTLTRSMDSNSFIMSGMDKYSDGMLIVGVNRNF